LVSAKHVFADQKNVIHESIARIRWFPHDVANDTATEMILDLRTLISDTNILVNNKVDVIVIKLGKTILIDSIQRIVYNPGIKRIGRTSALPILYADEINLINDCSIGSDAFIFGYPTALYLKSIPEYDSHRPLIRKGCIAGLSDKVIILDCPAYGGNSGGPVFEATRNDGLKLIGLVVRFVPFIQYWENKNYDLVQQEWENSGYSVVVPMDEVMAIINGK
jgi:hypothetical protein